MKLVNFEVIILLAITPKALCELRDDIPKALSDVVLKLMAKNAEDRYQGRLF